LASEYLKWKARDVTPDVPRKLTPREKWKNWWDYHKWHVLVGLVLLAVLCDIAASALGIGQVKPDYQIAYVGANALPDDTAAALEAGFAALGQDLNGDGTVTVQLHQYPVSGDSDAGYAYASQTALMADLTSCDSFFFLLEDPAAFQRSYHVLSRLDGALPAEGDLSIQGSCVSWSQCPTLAQMDLGDYAYPLMGQEVTGHSADLVSRLFLARRGFWTQKHTASVEGCQALWEEILKGASL